MIFRGLRFCAVPQHQQRLLAGSALIFFPFQGAMAAGTLPPPTTRGQKHTVCSPQSCLLLPMWARSPGGWTSTFAVVVSRFSASSCVSLE